MDSSDFAVRCTITQFHCNNHEKPVAFDSCKLTPYQRNWSVIEKEAYACVWASNRFRHWMFSDNITLYSDHNPLSYLCKSAPKSAKLMGWYLALQEFYLVKFCYRSSSSNQAADCSSWMVSYDDDPSGLG